MDRLNPDSIAASREPSAHSDLVSHSGISRDKTMDDKLTYVPINDRQNDPFSKLLVEKFIPTLIKKITIIKSTQSFLYMKNVAEILWVTM